MSSERGPFGTFDQGLITGASHAEQMAAGVNQFDSATFADLKVMTARNAADATLNQKLIEQGYFRHGVQTPRSTLSWVRLLNLLVIGLIAWISYVTYSSEKYRVATSSNVDLKSSSLPLELLDSRKYYQPEFVHLFKQGTNLNDLYAACKNKNCKTPDIQAFDSYRKFAVRAETYESDLCKYLSNSVWVKPEQLQPNWKLDRKNSECQVTNLAMLRVDVKNRNQAYLINIAVFDALLIGLLIGLNVFFNPKKK